MPLSQVEFVESWYDRLVSRTNEKEILPDAIRSLIATSGTHNCLEIGLGTSPFFANRLANSFDQYWIVEKQTIFSTLPKNVSFVLADWESYDVSETYDVIIASHVLYYFRDKKKAVEKILAHLSRGGRAFIVVNGKDGDYGPLKNEFSRLVGQPYTFTYDELKEILGERSYREHSISSSINFTSSEDLFETLRISFDRYPKEYEQLRASLLEYFRHSFSKGELVINQKIFEVSA